VHKLVLIFGPPSDAATFDRRWSSEFVPVAERMPGLRRVTVARAYGGPTGKSDVHLIHEFYFDDEASLRHAMTSPVGQLAGQALMGFAAGLVRLAFAEHLEEARPLPERAG
jgi:uncharacterized protein (TIGR02118 family)